MFNPVGHSNNSNRVDSEVDVMRNGVTLNPERIHCLRSSWCGGGAVRWTVLLLGHWGIGGGHVANEEQ
jgi:hypothetical protein